MSRLGFFQCTAVFGLLLGGISLSSAQERPHGIWQVQAESVSPDSPPSPTPDPTAPSPEPSPFASDSPFATNLAASSTFASGLRRPSSRLYDAPNMFGDLFSPGGQLRYQSNTELFFFDPNAGVQAMLNPATLQALQQQLSQDATRQALIQAQMEADRFRQETEDFIFGFDGQEEREFPEFLVDPSRISINVALPDLNEAIEIDQAAPQRVVINVAGMIDMQLAGGTRRTKIIENNHTLPQDRVFFLYNHFHNAITTDEFLLPTTDASGTTTNLGVLARRNVQSVNRFTLGLEKTFEAGQSSVEFRLPLIGDLAQTPGLDVQSQGGNVGNFAVILKRLFFTTDNFAVASGVGINLPTGSDARGRVGDVGWRVQNEAVHYLPFLGVAGAPYEDFFYQAFAQMDIAGTGNPADITDRRGRRRVGRLNDQTLLFLDATGGAWLYRNPQSRLAGIAALLELHYTTTLQDADQFGAVGGASNSILLFGNTFNQLDILNGSVGLHTVLQNGTSIRVGGVFPMQRRDHKRLFDSEVQASINVPF